MNDEWPHHHTVKANQEQIRTHGKKAWLAAKKKQWTCPECGAATYWYLKKCKCGRKLDAWELPESYKNSKSD